MLSTDGYVFLNIENPLCAWAAYRGVLVSTSAVSDGPGFVSVWLATMLSADEPASTSLEINLEMFRIQNFPNRISRLTGLYCFLDKQSAEQAADLWGESGRNHFKLEWLVELHFEEETGGDRLDTNWITFPPDNADGIPASTDWLADYWSGKPHLERDPIWETLVEGRVNVLGTDLRKLAYENVKQHWPDSICLLEIARLAAWIGSDLGNISAFITENDDEWGLQFLMDMRDAENADFLNRLRELIDSGHPINRADIHPFINNDSFGRTPDMRPFEFRRPKPRVS